MFRTGKRTVLTLMATFVAVFAIAAGNAHALLDMEEDYLPEKAEIMPDISLSSSFQSKYIWRGWNLGNEPVMQLDGSVSKWGFTFDWWANYTMNDEKGRDVGYQEFTEIDYTFDYTFNVGEMGDIMGYDAPDMLDPVSFSLGYVYYTFPQLDSDDKFFDTHEVYFGVAYDCILQPYFTWYWDVDSGKGNSDGGGDGSYFLFGLGHSFDLGESGATANFGWSMGVVDEQWTNKTGFGDMVFSCDVEIPFFNHFTVTPNVAYSLILDRDVYNDASENEFYGGVTIGFSY